MKLNRRQLATAGAAAFAGIAGGAWWLTREDEPKGASSQIDLVAGAYAGDPHTSMPDLLAMLSITGGMPKRTNLILRLFDLEGVSLGVGSKPLVSITNLISGEVSTDITLVEKDDHWQLDQSAVDGNGWWQVAVIVDDLTAIWTFMLPDPNLTGLDTPPKVETDPQAEAMLAAALDVLTQRTSLRWWEWLSGGNASIILAQFSVTTPASNGQPDSFENRSLMAGRIPLDGTAPTFRDEELRSVTVGDTAVSITGAGTPAPSTPTTYLPISEYDTTYAGYDGVHFGTTTRINDVDCQLVAFHLPGITPAWFAFWIETESLTLRELFMHSVNHYMHWVYFDIDEPFVLSLT
ncbi:MAG: hypothetical protein KC435_13315 [Thermomicrobiales bacterium]|nr:hypothetical protein [Thermomicrobiales bacterium]